MSGFVITPANPQSATGRVHLTYEMVRRASDEGSRAIDAKSMPASDFTTPIFGALVRIPVDAC